MSRGKNCLPTVSRQFLTRNYPRPNCLLKCLPNCLSPTGEGIFSSFKITPAVRVIARQLRGKNCPGAKIAPGHQDVSQGPLGMRYPPFFLFFCGLRLQEGTTRKMGILGTQSALFQGDRKWEFFDPETLFSRFWGFRPLYTGSADSQREQKNHIKKTHIKNFQKESGRGSGREASGPQFFMLVSFSKQNTVHKEFKGGSQGLGGVSKIQFCLCLCAFSGLEQKVVRQKRCNSLILRLFTRCS